MKCTVDVITPVYNHAEFIGECIDSVRVSVANSEIDINHIVVDDGSTDRTGDILREKAGSGLSVISFSQNAGHAAARNAGLKQSRADYIFFLDSDDIIFQNSLRYLVGSARRNGAHWIYGDFLRGTADSTYIIGDDYYGWQFESAQKLLTSMFTGRHFFQQNSLFQRTILEDIGGFDESLERAVDFDLCVRLLIAGHIPHYMSGPLYIHRYHDRNMSRIHQSDADLHRRQVAQSYERHKAYLHTILTPQSVSLIERYIS